MLIESRSGLHWIRLLRSSFTVHKHSLILKRFCLAIFVCYKFVHVLFDDITNMARFFELKLSLEYATSQTYFTSSQKLPNSNKYYSNWEKLSLLRWKLNRDLRCFVKTSYLPWIQVFYLFTTLWRKQSFFIDFKIQFTSKRIHFVKYVSNKW